MITLKKGELLNSEAEALVNTVNTEGVMGKGIALEFKEAFPKNYEKYREACKDGKIETGKMFVFETGSLTYPHYIINFPTKKHWRNPSKLEYIKDGLEDLERVIKKLKIKSIAIPPLGCGNGKLNWKDVKPLIESSINKFPEINALIFEPSNEAYKDTVKIKPKKDTGLTTIRALIISLLDRYRILGYDLTLLEAQKLAYFVQRFGMNLKLSYEKNQFGPYSRQFDYFLNNLEGFYVTGMNNRNIRPHDKINIINSKLPEVNEFIHNKITVKEKDVLDKVILLIEGFESPLGLELLSTVDFIINTTGTDDAVKITKEISNWSGDKKWNERKKNLLKPEFVGLAYDRLMEYQESLYKD